MSLRVVARIQSRPNKIDETRELLLALVEPTRQETGCIAYQLLQNRKDPTDFTFVEEWATDSAFEAHAVSDHIKAVSAKLQSVVAQAPDIRIYSIVA